MQRVWLTSLALVTISVLLCGAPAAADPGPRDGSKSAGHSTPIADVLARFDEVQDTIRTMSAQFTETTVNQLLKSSNKNRGFIDMSSKQYPLG